MTTFKCFEDMHAWRSARELVKRTHESSRNRDFSLRAQIRRTAVSVRWDIADDLA